MSFTWSVEISTTSLRANCNVFPCGIKLKQIGGHLSIFIALPFLVVPREITIDVTFDIATAIEAFPSVTVAKARSASEFIFRVNQKMTCCTNVAFFPFHVLLAGTDTRLLVALGSIVNASFGFALTTITASVVKVPVVGSALVTFFTTHTRLALAFAIRSTL